MDRKDRHYLAVAEYYGDKTTARSGVPLIAHIDEGLLVLDAIDASTTAMQAYCIHPLIQGDEALNESLLPGSIFLKRNPELRAVVLAMEYRRVANTYLSEHCIAEGDTFDLSPLIEVNQMLIADKVQNRKDFEIYHFASHPRSATLALYFRNWLTKLGISEQQYQMLRSKMVEI